MTLPASTVEMLRCPQCHARVVESGDRLVCSNGDHRLAFPVRDGIPVMIVDEADAVTPDEWDSILQRQQSESGNP